ncbi:glycosyl hydrolase family 5 [Paracoccus sp. MC1854]|nr:glycosyl hydrolase family 5 [Paracoccus sp. MC1854]
MALWPSNAQPEETAEMVSWPSWSAEFLSAEGRVLDSQQGGISHSEGQAYGLLLAQASGDEASFRLIEKWTRKHLAVRQDHLMGWKWGPTSTYGTLLDWRNATDGDLFRAWALLRAARDSNWRGYEDRYQEIAQSLVELCLAPDPRVPSEWLLTPGAEARRAPGRVLVNPSYFMTRALRELGAATGQDALIRCADHAETVLSEMAATGFLADWVDVTETGFSSPQEHDFRWGHDALRIPLYLVWSGRRTHPAVQLGADLLHRATVPDHLAVEIGQDGEVRAISDLLGYQAIAALAECRDPGALTASSVGRTRPAYYPATLAMLAQVALRESGC